jgi:hypothetical protein
MYDRSIGAIAGSDMNVVDSPASPGIFLVFFALLWLGVTTLLGVLSGCYSLMRRYPDRAEASLLTHKYQSGSLGLVGMRGVLHLGVCASGLRIGLMRVFGPFCRNFSVPWSSISVSRKDRLFSRISVLDFGSRSLGLPAEVAYRLVRAAGSHWPEPGLFPEEPHATVRSRLLKEWRGTGL